MNISREGFWQYVQIFSYFGLTQLLCNQWIKYILEGNI